MSLKLSLKYLTASHIPLGKKPHPIWSSSRMSPSITRSATIHAKVLVGTYRCDSLVAKWTGESDACCLCGHENGINILRSHPELLSVVVSSLSISPEDWTQLVVDPTTNPSIISLVQKLGERNVIPFIVRFSRSYIWAMHRQRLRLKEDMNPQHKTVRVLDA